jgi:LAS superfamily LD-carboxypeptidase LdcB
MSQALRSAHCLGLDESHLIQLPDSPHRLWPATAVAFMAMQQAARADGIKLTLASSYRSFDRQLLIWNEKFTGLRPVLDADSRPLDVTALNDEARIHAILRWSALPGTSRHHWGTDMDIYAPDLLPSGQTLQLEPWEYSPSGYFADLTRWLDSHMQEYGFCRPFAHDHGGVAVEPWHLSDSSESLRMSQFLTLEALAACLQQSAIAGKACILAHLPALWQRYILPTLPTQV